MNVKLKVLTAGVLFFTGQALSAQQTKSDSTSKQKEIEEVVVIGYKKVKISQATGNYTQLKSSDINTPAAISVDQALQGKTPGVAINATSGTPGSVQNIMIRGLGSMTANNQPLYVIDGVPIVSGNIGTTTAGSSLSPIAGLKNEDIESLTILKDAVATAQYGARGSNGVIIINTKSGRRGKTRFNLNTAIGYQNDAFMKRKALTGEQRYNLLSQALVHSYGAKYGITTDNAVAWATDQGLVNGWDGTSTNWADILTRKNAQTYSVDFSATGGDDKGTFYTSLGYNRTYATVIVPNPYERLSGMLRLTRNLSSKLKLDASVNGSWSTQNSILEQGSYFANPYLSRILLTPWLSPYAPDGSLSIGDNWSSSLYNPLYIMQNNISRNTLLKAIGNVKLDYTILKGLTYSTRAAFDYMSVTYKDYSNRYHGEALGKNGAATINKFDNFNLVFQNSLNYNFNVGEKHSFDVTALHEYIKNQENNLSGYGEGFAADGLTNLSSTSTAYAVSSSFFDWYNVAYLGMLNYTFADRLSVDASIRREGSSRFASGNRFGTFWAVGGSYNLHKDILSNVFNELKLRASYGLTGNAGINLNQYQALVSYSDQYNTAGAITPSVFGNQNLSWEKNKTFDAGISFALLNDRLTGSFGYYNKHTYDLLQNVPLSRTNGFTSQTINAGAMTNSGIEAQLGVKIFDNENFKWSVSANLGTVKNKVDQLALDANGNPINPTASSYKNTEVGYQFAYWYMPTWAGVDTQTGAPLWYINGVDGETTSNYNSAKRAYQGTAIPKYNGGFATNIRYKNVFLNANFYFSGGHKVYDQYSQFYLRTGAFALGTYNGDQDLLDAWQKPGDVTDVPVLDFARNNNFHNVSSRHLYDGTFLRLKDITLGFELPSEYLRSIGVDGLTFTVRGTNLWTWVKDKGLKLDPETGNSGNSIGYTTLTSPPVKSVIFGVNVKF